jgi:hypothetical protein
MIRPYNFSYNPQTVNTPMTVGYKPGQDTSERTWFAPTYTPLPPYQAANGGIIALAGGGLAGGGPVERMSNQAATGANTMYPMANMATSAFATPYQTPISTNMIAPAGGNTVDAMTGEPTMQGTRMAGGGVTGSGNLDLHIPLDLGGGGGGANGYQAAGFGNGQQTALGQSSSIGPLTPLPATQTQAREQAMAANPMADDSGMGRANGFGPQNDTTTSDTFQPQQAAQQATGISSLNSLMSLLQGQNMGNAYAKPTQMAAGGIARYGFGGGIEDVMRNANDVIQPASKIAVDAQSAQPPNPQQAARQFNFNPETGQFSRMGEQVSTAPKTDDPNQYIFDPETGQYSKAMAMGGMSHLGGYSDGGRLLRGPGDGVSDSIPAQIGNKQPARLADGEFVVPARIVSELGNGSTEAGARQLYKMLDRVQNARAKTTGKSKVAKNTNAAKYLPA